MQNLQEDKHLKWYYKKQFLVWTDLDIPKSEIYKMIAKNVYDLFEESEEV